MITRLCLFLPARCTFRSISSTSISSSGGQRICAYSQRESSGLVTALGFIFDCHCLPLLPSLAISRTSSALLTSSLDSGPSCVTGRAILGCLPHKLQLFEDMGRKGADDRLGCCDVVQWEVMRDEASREHSFHYLEVTRSPKNMLALLA